ncbi:MAG: hypothetical protein M3O46_02775 [Myxococcota bacterium]|nr:hypothetical protein [Myxococcota bacterium]
MNERVPPLDGRLLAALRAERPAPQDVRQRVRTRLEAAIPEMRRGPGGGGSHGGGANGGSGPRLRGFVPHTIGVAAFVAGGITGAALFASLARTPAPQFVYVDRMAPAAIVAEGASLAGAAVPATSLPSERAQAVPVRGSPAYIAKPGRGISAAPHASRLTEERVLLDEARAGLVQGDPQRALQRLDLHRTRFADGLLAEERDAMQVEALAGAGRYDEARARADAFRARQPTSLFLPTVESAIASIP